MVTKVAALRLFGLRHRPLGQIEVPNGSINLLVAVLLCRNLLSTLVHTGGAARVSRRIGHVEFAGLAGAAPLHRLVNCLDLALRQGHLKGRHLRAIRRIILRLRLNDRVLAHILLVVRV